MEPIKCWKTRQNWGYIVFFSILTLLVVSTYFRNSHSNKMIENELKIRDYELDTFNMEAFKRVRPYINLLVNHYGHSGNRNLQKFTYIADKFDESVKLYSQDLSDANFDKLSRVIYEIRKDSHINTLKDLVQAKAEALTILILCLAPLPSDFTANAQVSMMKDQRFREDKLMAYLGTLRFVNIFRGFLILPLWLERYKNDDFIEKFGNVLFRSDFDGENDGIIKNSTFTDRLISNIPELKIKKTKFNEISFDEIIAKHSEANVEVFQHTKKLELNVNIDNFFKKKIEEMTELLDLVIIKMAPGLSVNFVQIVERISVLKGEKEVNYDLKGIVILDRKKIVANNSSAKQSESLALMVFDDEFHFWNLFHDDNGKEKILSMPRQFARKYSNQNGSHFIYYKK